MCNVKQGRRRVKGSKQILGGPPQPMLGLEQVFISKVPLTAVYVLHLKMWLLFSSGSAGIQTSLSNKVREFCGRLDRHP